MHTIFSQQTDDPGNELASPAEIQKNTYPYQHEVNITDGGEFLDDAIRRKDQPLGETKERNTR